MIVGLMFCTRKRDSCFSDSLERVDLHCEFCGESLRITRGSYDVGVFKGLIFLCPDCFRAVSSTRKDYTVVHRVQVDELRKKGFLFDEVERRRCGVIIDEVELCTKEVPGRKRFG